MRFNERQVINMSMEKADFEGRLHYKKVWSNYPNSKGFKEKWFKLKSNMLFYFKLNDTRQLCLKQPSGLFILEDSKVQIEEAEAPFAFSITFRDDFDRKHLFAGRSERDVHDWINALNAATFGHWRKRLCSLQERILEKHKEQPQAKLENHLNLASSASTTFNLIEF